MNTHSKYKSFNITCAACPDGDRFVTAIACAKHVYDEHENIVVGTEIDV